MSIGHATFAKLKAVLELGLSRLGKAFLSWPSAEGWLITLGLFSLFALSTLLILRISDLFTLSLTDLPLKHVLLLGVIALFTPSLPEETLYRALLLPHPGEGGSLAASLAWGGVSLLLYVGAHPLLALVAWPWARQIFYRPAFLSIVALLGLTCSLAYVQTGSVWAPIVIHWATIVGWKIFFGGPDFNLRR